MKKIAIIPARSGSKGLPNKNVLLAGGKTLIGYSIEAAINAGCFDKIIVTTDSQEYIDLLANYPIEFVLRNKDLASDTASSYVVIQDVLNRYSEYDYFVLLQPTSPLRDENHIKQSIEKFEKKYTHFDFLVSVCKNKPLSIVREIDQDESLKNFDLDYSNYSRQSFAEAYSPNGAIFIGKTKEYLLQKHFYGRKALAFEMDKISSLDIDDRDDFEYFYYILQQRNKDKALLNNIKNRILIKKDEFENKSDITFIGHSILDQWNICTINNKKIVNLGIGGISTQEYIDLIISKGLLKNIGNEVVLMCGTNDIVKPNYSPEKTTSDIQKLIREIKNINLNTKIYFLEITPTFFRSNRKNVVIKELNSYLKNNLTDVVWVDLYDKFLDKYGKLNLNYTYDGLHLNEKGYELLERILETYL